MNFSVVIGLSDFQRFLTLRKGFTTTEAISLCERGDRAEYVRLWAEFEAFSKEGNQ